MILYMALMAALAGGSIPLPILDKLKITWLPELLFSLGFVYALYPLIGWWSLLASPWSYIWMQTGHANALSWGKNANPARKNTLTPLVELLTHTLSIKGFGRAYSAVFFAVKGFLITLPVGGTGVILWPLAYDIGVNLEGKLKQGRAHLVSELLGGAGAGLSIIVFEKAVNGII